MVGAAATEARATPLKRRLRCRPVRAGPKKEPARIEVIPQWDLENYPWLENPGPRSIFAKNCSKSSSPSASSAVGKSIGL